MEYSIVYFNKDKSGHVRAKANSTDGHDTINIDASIYVEDGEDMLIKGDVSMESRDYTTFDGRRVKYGFSEEEVYIKPAHEEDISIDDINKIIHEFVSKFR